MAYVHQDHTIYKLKSKTTVQSTKVTTSNVEKKYNSDKNTQSAKVDARTIEKNADSEDVIRTPKVTNNFCKQMQQARQEKQMTQKQLAFACNLPESKIKDYENGTAIPNQKEISKINKALGLVLKNK